MLFLILIRKQKVLILYITSAIHPKTNMNIIVGFKGNESILTKLPISDMDENGIIELWKFKMHLDQFMLGDNVWLAQCSKVKQAVK